MKEIINEVKRQPLEIIANETADEGLISKIYKHFIQLNTRKTNNPRIKPASPALPGRFFTTEPPGKPIIALSMIAIFKFLFLQKSKI